MKVTSGSQHIPLATSDTIQFKSNCTDSSYVDPTNEADPTAEGFFVLCMYGIHMASVFCIRVVMKCNRASWVNCNMTSDTDTRQKQVAAGCNRFSLQHKSSYFTESQNDQD